MTDRDTPTLELYVRSLSADARTSRVGDVLERLARMDEDGEIDGYEVTVWGDGVSYDDRVLATDAAQTIHDTVDELRAWSVKTNTELLGFEERTVQSVVTDEVHHTLSVPTMALVERRDGDVSWVAPCDDGVTHTIDDRLDSLGDGVEESKREPFAIEADD